MCDLHNTLRHRAEIMLPGEIVSFSRESLLALLAGAPPRGGPTTMRERSAACESQLAAPDICKALWTVADLAARLGTATSTLRGMVADGIFGPPPSFRHAGHRGYQIAGAIAEQMTAHVYRGEDLRNFLCAHTGPVATQEQAAWSNASSERAAAESDASRAVGAAPRPSSRTATTLGHTSRRAPASAAAARRSRPVGAAPEHDLGLPGALDSWRHIENPKVIRR